MPTAPFQSRPPWSNRAVSLRHYSKMGSCAKAGPASFLLSQIVLLCAKLSAEKVPLCRYELRELFLG